MLVLLSEGKNQLENIHRATNASPARSDATPDQPKNIADLAAQNIEIRSYEDFEKENAKIEAYIDRIEAASPDGKIDIFDPEFWFAYYNFFDRVWTEEYLPFAGSSQIIFAKLCQEQKQNKPSPDRASYNQAYTETRSAMGYIFSGRSRIFSGYEQMLRIKGRTLIHMLENAGIPSDAIEIAKRALPTCYSDNERRYGAQQEIPSQIFHEVSNRRAAAAISLAQHPSYHRVLEIAEQFRNYHRIYQEARRTFFGFIPKFERQGVFSDIRSFPWMTEQRSLAIPEEEARKAITTMVERHAVDFVQAALADTRLEPEFIETADTEVIRRLVYSGLLSQMLPPERVVGDSNDYSIVSLRP